MYIGIRLELIPQQNYEYISSKIFYSIKIRTKKLYALIIALHLHDLDGQLAITIDMFMFFDTNDSLRLYLGMKIKETNFLVLQNRSFLLS